MVFATEGANSSRFSDGLLAMTDLFNLTRLAKPLTWEEGLRILERELAPQQNACE
jgi:hypothetical protein